MLSKPVSVYCGHGRFWWWKHLKDAAEYLLSWTVRQGHAGCCSNCNSCTGVLLQFVCFWLLCAILMLSLLYCALGWYSPLSSSARLYLCCLLVRSKECLFVKCLYSSWCSVHLERTHKAKFTEGLSLEIPEITPGELKCRIVLWVSVRRHWSFSRESEEAGLLSLKIVAESLTPWQ